MMGVKESLKLLAASNLIHGIAAVILFLFIGENESDFFSLENQYMFWIILTMLMADWSCNLNFFAEVIRLYPSNLKLKISTLGFGLLSLLFRIETTHVLVMRKMLLFDLSTMHILLLSSAFFAYNLINISTKEVAGEMRNVIASMGWINIALAGGFFIEYQLLLLDVLHISSSLIFLNLMKYLIMPFIMTLVFYSWSEKTTYEISKRPKKASTIAA